MLELLSRHTAGGCTYLQAILLIVSVATAVCLFLGGVIPFFAAEIREDIAYKKSSQQEGILTEGRAQKNKPDWNIPQKGGKVKGV